MSGAETYQHFNETDFADPNRYKPIIIASACAGLIIWSMLLWTTTLIALQVVQIFYGFFMAAEVAYYTLVSQTINEHFCMDSSQASFQLHVR